MHINKTIKINELYSQNRMPIQPFFILILISNYVVLSNQLKFSTQIFMKFSRFDDIASESRLKQGSPRSKDLSNPNRLRIISGSAKGLKIDSPDIYLRPMMSKVRNALFNTLFHLEVFSSPNITILDTYAGSGSVGLEALSRGASFATFVDFSDISIETIRSNAIKCRFSDKISTICGKTEDVLKFPSSFNLVHPFSLISLTPPYEEISYPALLESLCSSPLLTEDTIVFLEYPIELKSLPFILGNQQLFGLRNRRYGRTILAIYVNKPSKQYEFKPEEFTQKFIAKFI